MKSNAPAKSSLGDIIALRSDHLISAAIASDLLMITNARIRQLVEEGRIPDGPRKGVYQLVGLVHGYIRSLKDEEKSRSRVAAESGVKRARELEIMQRVRERSGQLIETNEAAEALDDIVSLMVTELDSLPASFTRDMKVRRALQVKIDGIRDRINARLDDKIVALRAGASASDEEADPDA